MIAYWRRLTEAHPRIVDALILLVLLGDAVIGSRLLPPGPGAPKTWWLGFLVTVIASVALLWRRSRPREVAAVAGAAAISVAGLGYIPSVLLIGPAMIGLFSLAYRSDRRTANTYAVAIICLLMSAAVFISSSHEQLVLQTIGPAAWLFLPLSLGTATRVRRENLALVQARADYAERTREQEARHRVAEERMRIARDLHDVVAHHLALANAQVTTATYVARKDPDKALEILAEVGSTTSAALRELKATVGLLRHADEPEVPTGLAQLPELAASFASIGLAVEVGTAGQPRRLDSAVDLTAFRITQEALTNVRKHAATDKARVQVRYGQDRITITITDEATARRPKTAESAANSGFGLIGMRERAQSVGGRLRTGPRPEGGFQVSAELPFHIQNPEPTESA